MKPEEKKTPKMDIVNDTGLEIGWQVGRVLPHRLSATFILKGTFDLEPGGAAAPAEEPLPLDDEIYEGEPETSALRYPGDYGLFKPRADLLLVGDCVPPGGKTASVLRVEFAVGRWKKVLAVIGDRTWSAGMPSNPAPFQRVPLRWENSYGGAGYALNPVGKGHEGRVLPNLEDPERLLRSRSRPPGPAGFAPLPRTWPQRNRNPGTYDARWRIEDWPWFPKDFDWSHFNAAPADQQIDAFLRGDETLRVTNMHPDHPDYACRLPGLRPRWFVLRKDGERETFHDLRLHLDTLWVDMKAEQIVLVWRAVLPVADRKLKDVRAHYVVTEPLEDDPGEPAAHRRRFEERLAAEEAGPPEEEEEPEGEILPPETALLDGALERKRFERLSLDQEERLARVLVEKGQAHGPAVKLLRENSGNIRLLGPIWTYFEGLQRLHPELAGQVGPPPLPDEALHEAMIRPEPPWTRNKVAAWAPKGFDFSEEDLGNLDLSRLDLDRASFAGAILTGASLKGASLKEANLQGAFLDGADLAAADLGKATLADADLTEANLEKATLAEANAAGADFSGAAMAGAKLEKAQAEGALFAEADLEEAILREAALKGADFTGAKVGRAVFDGADLAGALFAGASGEETFFRGAMVGGLQAAGARLPKARFRDARGDGPTFDEAFLDGADFLERPSRRRDSPARAPARPCSRSRTSRRPASTTRTSRAPRC